MEWLAILFAVELGWAMTPAWLATVPEPEYMDQVVQLAPEQTSYTGLECEALILDLLRIGGAVTTYSKGIEGTVTYAPWTADYWFWAGVEYRGFSLGWRHICRHGILSAARPDVGYLFGGGDILYARYEGRID